MPNNNKYREYFDIDERYFPCIDDAAIDAGAPWENTYPHSTFIDMLTEMERALARQNSGRTLWIEGAYGTGKSQCALALRRILEVPEEELRDYWDRYEPLKQKTDLREKLIGHKKKGIVVAHRYASGGIMSARDLFFAIQESVKAALLRQNIAYLGENTLKESIIAWLEDADHKLMFDSLLQNPDKEWRALFSQSKADEVLNVLRKNGEVKSLVDNIFRLADKEGITALSIDSDRLIAWLTDIIDQNNTRIVFIWDEFSDYFKNNRESLSEFQKVAALVQNKPFYFIVVTHEPQQIYVADNDRGNQSKVSDRFTALVDATIRHIQRQFFSTAKEMHRAGIPADYIKYIVPESLRTSFSWTINLRSFINFLELRTDKHAHFEIRHIANEMRRMISESLAAKYVDEILKEMDL